LKNAAPIVRARAADAIEKISKVNSEYIQNYKSKLICEIAPKVKQKKLRRHIAQLISYLILEPKENDDTVAFLVNWLDKPKENSKIVKVFCIQTLAELAKDNKELEQVIT
jgi:hypothetical protein